MNQPKHVKDIVKLRIKNQYFFRVAHLFEDMITNLTFYKLARTPLKKDDFTLTEITPYDISEEMKKALFQKENEVEINETDKDLLIQAFRIKYEHVKAIANKKINRGFQQRVLHVIEVAGFYFVHVLEEGMPYPKVYQLFVDMVEQNIKTEPVPLPLVSAISEALAQEVFALQSDYITQIGEGSYLRISKTSKNKALSIVVIAEEGEGETGNISVKLSFLMNSKNEKVWNATLLKGEQYQEWLGDIEESFNTVYVDLLSKLYGFKGEEAIKDL